MFLKVPEPEGFQRKKNSSCADTLLLPCISLFTIQTKQNETKVWNVISTRTPLTTAYMSAGEHVAPPSSGGHNTLTLVMIMGRRYAAT